MEKAHVWRATALCDRRTSTTVTVESPKVSFLFCKKSKFTLEAFVKFVLAKESISTSNYEQDVRIAKKTDVITT